jgi:hypothetical protein
MVIAGVVGAGFAVVIGQLVDQPQRKKLVIGVAVLAALTPLWHPLPPLPGCSGA